MSGRHRVSAQLVAGGLTVAVAAALVYLAGVAGLVMALLVLASTLLVAVGLVNLRWILDAWWTPVNHAMRAELLPGPTVGSVAPVPRAAGTSPDRGGVAGAGPKVSLLVPARHEVAVLAATLERIAQQRYDDYEVIVVVGHDDPGTAAVAQECGARLGARFRVVVDAHPVKNKPRALNTGLAAATGEVVGVFDAEDDVHPDLLRHVVGAFADPTVGVVQGPVQIMNHDSRWFTVHNVLEYFFYFGSRLHHHARAGFVPLGGNTVFLRRDLLVGSGWDGENLTEDCELGVRLSAAGARIRVLYRPELATREEAPVSVQDFVRQRSRWNQGFLQTYRKGVWRNLPWRQRALARVVLTMPLLQALAFVVMPLTVLVGVLADFPLIVGLYTYLPLAVLIATASVQVVGLREFGARYQRRVTWWNQVVMVAGIVPYGVLLLFAAFRAVMREGRGDRRWEKTAHVDAHRVIDPSGALAS